MASEALIRNHIDGILSELSEQQYRDWIADDLDEIENNRKTVNSGFRSDVTGLSNEAAALEEALIRFEATNVYDYSNSLYKIVRLMKRYQEIWIRFQRRVTRTLETTNQLCREFEENIGDYLPEVEFGDVIDKMGTEPLTANLPIIGPVEIGFDEMEKRVSRLGFSNLESYVESRIAAKDYSGFPLRTQELTGDCYETIKEIEAYRDKIENRHLADLTRLQPLGANAVNHLSSLQVKPSPLINQFTQLLTEVLGLALSVEIEAPDVSRDKLFASLLQACDSGNRNTIVEIAEILGLDADTVETMSTTQLCKLLIDTNLG
jgi:hypothetical protein